MSSNSKAVLWIIAGLIAIGGCMSNTSPSSSPSGGTSSGGGSSSGTSSYCKEAGTKQFTSFSDPAWKEFIRRCS